MAKRRPGTPRRATLWLSIGSSLVKSLVFVPFGLVLARSMVARGEPSP